MWGVEVYRHLFSCATSYIISKPGKGEWSSARPQFGLNWGGGGDWVGPEPILGFPKKIKFPYSCRESIHDMSRSVITRKTKLHWFLRLCVTRGRDVMRHCTGILA
jgi:hypothetical protein